jgi:hypothetical protein
MFIPPPPPVPRDEYDNPPEVSASNGWGREVEFRAAAQPSGNWLQQHPALLVPIFAAFLAGVVSLLHCYRVAAGPTWRSIRTGRVTTYTWEELPTVAIVSALIGAGLGFLGYASSARKGPHTPASSVGTDTAESPAELQRQFAAELQRFLDSYPPDRDARPATGANEEPEPPLTAEQHAAVDEKEMTEEEAARFLAELDSADGGTRQANKANIRDLQAIPGAAPDRPRD